MKYFSIATKSPRRIISMQRLKRASQNLCTCSITECMQLPSYLGSKLRISYIFSILMIAQIMIGISTAVYAQSPIVGVASVIDGDTLEISGVRIRLHGIDAPESRQQCVRLDGEFWRCGQQAALALSDRIGRTVIRCQPRDRDRYGRIIAVCFKDTEDLDRWMVARGWAVAFRKYSLDYVGDEQSAKRGKLGIWSGSFEMPWDWRARGSKN